MPRKKRSTKVAYKPEKPKKVQLDVSALPIHNDISLIDYSWLGLGNINNIQIENPLTGLTDLEKENPGLREVALMRNRHYLSFACKTLLSMDGMNPLDILPLQAAMLEEMWIRPFPMLLASRGGSKTTLLAIYSLLRCALNPGIKVVGIGAGFRQSKLIFEKAEEIWNNSPVLRSICDNSSGPKRENDKCVLKINESTLTVLPVGNGEKIRGYRASIIISDEFGSISPDIYEVVISGFAAVEASPVKGVKEASRRHALKSLSLWSDEQQEFYDSRPRNQSIISGTATWNFNHFAAYWRRYKAIIESKGDLKKLELIIGDIPSGFNWKDYSIIRIPFELIPEGFMNEGIVARAKATAGNDAYMREYACVFTDDSDGFFKRSLIESCVTSDMSPIEFPSGSVWFDPMIKGNPSKKYVYGIDPSIGSSMADKETDNFTISILEIHDDHTRIVYLWSTNRAEFRRRLNTGILKQQQFYAFCARKIRDLMKSFPCCHMAMDAQGGGVLLYEALNDENNMEAGEQKIWEVVEDGKEKDTDSRSGLHVLEMCQFARYDWLKEANYGMHKDFSDKTLLFPRYDVVSLGLAAEEDGIRLKDIEKKNPGQKVMLLDTYEDCVMEIEELKDELASIVVTVVGSGVNVRERWDTPEIKTAAGKKGRMRKDRYSALLMANAAARKMQRVAPALEYNVVGGRVGVISGKGDGGPLYFGPDWYTQGLTDDIGVVRRNSEW